MHAYDNAGMDDKLLYSKANAAELLSLSVRKLDSLIANHRIVVTRIGKRVLIAREALERFVHEDREPAR